MIEGVPIDSMDFVLEDNPFGDWPEPQYGDPDYDYGVTDDGWVRPGPCPICGAPDWTCTTDYLSQHVALLPDENLVASDVTWASDDD